MIANFPACLNVILASEGGFVDDILDPGGATCLGITQHTLSGWLRRPATIADVQALTSASVAPLYRADFWNPTQCDNWKSGVDLLIFDEAVNQGPGRAIRTLQEAVGVPADGLLGPKTLVAARRADALATIDNIKTIRLDFYHSLPTWPHFGAGWTNRLNRTAGLAEQMAQA